MDFLRITYLQETNLMFLSTLNAWGGLLLVIFQIVAILYGAIKLMTKITTRLDKLEEQYRPNGGSSMRDAINRIELNLSKLDGKFEQHIEEHKK
jgi:hypothetical protein